MKMILEKYLTKLLIDIQYVILKGSVNEIQINKLVYDTRNIENNDLFVCLKGANFDSHSVIKEIISDGAKVIVVENGNPYIDDIDIPNEIVVIAVNDTRKALAIISRNYFNNPITQMKLVGITGTKGKTTTAFMIKKVLEESGYKVGMIGTVGVYFGNEYIETENTTPESYLLYKYFATMLEKKCDYVVMEVSSQSLKYNRVYGIKYDYVLWTNISPEHIGENEHIDYDDYLHSKLKIFENTNIAIVNSNTNNMNDILKICSKNNVEVVKNYNNVKFSLKLPGEYNAENANLVYVFCSIIKLNKNIILRSLNETVVPGRCEVVYKNDEYEVIVDFAHEQNGAKAFLETMKEYISKKENVDKRLVVVFGCGGNRAKERRYGMGEVVGKLADFVILTADNSRFEKTIDIIADIETTLSKYKQKNNLEKGYVIKELRKDAIEYAIKNHKKGDVICIIGKGHETNNEANGIKTHFSDREEVLKLV